MKKFVIAFQHEKQPHSIAILAEDWGDADALLKSLKNGGKLIGELVKEIPLGEANRRQQRRVRNKTLATRRTRREAPPHDDSAERMVSKLLKMKAGEPPRSES